MSTLIAGVDEAGRGPLAGPVVVAAVILYPAVAIAGLGDSKALSAAQRESLAPQIRERALAWTVIVVEVDEIDRLNIFHATMAGMTRSVLALATPPREVLIDGKVDAIDQAAVRYYRQISHPAADAMAPQPAAAALYRLLLAPIVPLLGGRTRLLVCPESLLHQIPLAALHDGVDWLLGRYEFTFLTSVTQLLRPAAPPPRDSTVVVFADQHFAFVGPAVKQVHVAHELVHKRRLWVAVNIVGSADLLNLSLIENHHPVSNFERFFLIVRHEYARDMNFIV